jgi:hypothetical protein
MMDVNDPLMVMFGILASAAAGGGVGFVAGTTLGRTRPATPLPATIQLTRDQLAAACAQLDKASAKLGSAQQGELAGGANVVSKRLSQLAAALGRIGHKAKREGTA